MHTPTIALTIALLGSLFLTTGCAQQTTTPAVTAADELPGVAAYYRAATDHHVRPFRKTYRDQRVVALRNLASATDRLLAESATWDSDARLISLAEPERDARRTAVEDFRTSLRELHAAAGKNDLAAVRANYARASKAYRAVAIVADERPERPE